MSRLINVKEAAKELQVSVSHFRKMLHNDEIPYIQISERVIRFERDKLLAHVKRKFTIPPKASKKKNPGTTPRG